MEAERHQADPEGRGAPAGPAIAWESFYANYRKPGYVPGYEIVNKLGGGMFGLVFKARKESIGKDYAIKFLKVDDETVRDAVRRELDQVRFVAQIDHPNIVSIEDRGEVDGIPYIVMNYAGQDTLRKRLDAGTVTREEALRIFAQAVRGVQALHEHSLVHFDLKPSNIFLKGDVARVGDYGLSKLVTESRNSLSFGRGTPYYMAPEMLRRRGDARSDIYSLGVILYECLTGDVPFRGDSEWEVLKKHESEEPRYPDGLTAEHRRILERCLAKDPERRYATAADLLRDLKSPAAHGESLLIRGGPGAPFEPPGKPIPPPPPRRPALGDSDGPDGRDSPYGMPWRADRKRGRPLRLLVRGIFAIVELSVFFVLLPVRIAGQVFGGGLLWLLQLPLRILGTAARLAGYLIVAGLVMGAVALALAVAGALQ
ncbi:MAG: hypothetical protein Fur0037_10600 [Planctomycetota bacterium]